MFGKGLTGEDIFSIIIAVVILTFAVILIVKAVNRNKNNRDDSDEPYNRYAKN